MKAQETVTLNREDLQFIIRMIQTLYDGDDISTEDYHHMTELQNADLNTRIRRVLLDLGVRQGVLGYNYLRTGIRLAYHDPSFLKEITTRLYPAIAEEHGTTAARAERAMRHSIEVCFNSYGSEELKEEIFGNSIDGDKGKVPNSQFIAAVVDYLHQ